MNIVNKLTLRHLKENKGRSIVTTMGIVVSVAMITAVFVALASFLNLFGEVAILSDGNRAAYMYGMTESQIEELRQNEKVDTVGVAIDEYKEFQIDKVIGTMYASDLENSKMVVTAKYDGTLPKNENEIAVENDFIRKNKLDWKLNDTINLNCENKVLKFKIVSILYDNYPTCTSPIICGLTNYSGENIITSFQMKDLNTKSFDEVNEIINNYGLKDRSGINSELLGAHFAYEQGGTIELLLPLVAIVLVIIIIASVVLIYNAFAMSLAEKVKYLGMLSSVGATKAQKRKSIYYEGFILGAIGLPIGFAAGIAGIGITLKLLGNKIISTGMLAGANKENLTMKIVIPWWVIVGIIIISAFTIFISCAIPAIKASNITPISAIRQSNEVKVKSRTLRSPKIVKALFGYEGELAHKNLKRNGRKARVITVSIALSVILFLSCNYFCNLFVRSADVSAMPYQVGAYYANESLAENEIKNLKTQVSKIDGVDAAYCIENTGFHTNSLEDVPEKAKQIFDKKNLTKTYSKQFEKSNTFYINLVDDEDFNELCQKNNIDYTKYYNGNVKVLLMNNISHNISSLPVFNDNILGTVFQDVNIDEEFDITIEDFIKYDKNNNYCNINSFGSVSMYVPFSVYHKMSPTTHYMLGVETKDHESVANKIKELDDDIIVSDYMEQAQTINTVVLIIQVFVYGFISLISLITIFNIINTISTGIIARRKEFAMLKSVGITPKGFNKMIMLESVFYGLRAMIFALPISVLISYLMNFSLGDSSLAFEINWIMYLAVIVVVFLIIGATMLHSVKQVQKENIIETLKEDIN